MAGKSIKKKPDVKKQPVLKATRKTQNKDKKTLTQSVKPEAAEATPKKSNIQEEDPFSIPIDEIIARKLSKDMKKAVSGLGVDKNKPLDEPNVYDSDSDVPKGSTDVSKASKDWECSATLLDESLSLDSDSDVPKRSRDEGRSLRDKQRAAPETDPWLPSDDSDEDVVPMKCRKQSKRPAESATSGDSQKMTPFPAQMAPGPWMMYPFNPWAGPSAFNQGFAPWMGPPPNSWMGPFAGHQHQWPALQQPNMPKPPETQSSDKPSTSFTDEGSDGDRVDTVDKVLDMYEKVLSLKRKGYSLAKSLRRIGKNLVTFKRVQPIAELSILRPRMFKEVKKDWMLKSPSKPSLQFLASMCKGHILAEALEEGRRNGDIV